MNKSKFKTVRFKPFNLSLAYLQRTEQGLCWTNEDTFGNDLINDVYFSDSCIEAYPELFEVEKAGREFEEGEYYWAKVWKWSDWDAVKYSHGVFYFVGVPTGFTPNRLYLIGGKIGR